MTYARFMRGLGWLLLGVSVLVLVLGIVAGFSLANEYGWGGLSGVLSGVLTIIGLTAVPALGGWLVLRIGRKAE